METKPTLLIYVAPANAVDDNLRFKHGRWGDKYCDQTGIRISLIDGCYVAMVRDDDLFEMDPMSFASTIMKIMQGRNPDGFDVDIEYPFYTITEDDADRRSAHAVMLLDLAMKMIHRGVIDGVPVDANIEYLRSNGQSLNALFDYYYHEGPSPYLDGNYLDTKEGRVATIIGRQQKSYCSEPREVTDPEPEGLSWFERIGENPYIPGDDDDFDDDDEDEDEEDGEDDDEDYDEEENPVDFLMKSLNGVKDKKKPRDSKKPKKKPYEVSPSKILKNAKNAKKTFKKHGGLVIRKKSDVEKDAKTIAKFLDKFLPGDEKWMKEFRNAVLVRWIQAYAVTAKCLKKFERRRKKERHQKRMARYTRHTVPAVSEFAMRLLAPADRWSNPNI